jgi:ubiquinone/menaquinone biosynthesis C-methylase UbiE
MKIDLLSIYEKREGTGIKYEYDKSGKKRPAWIKLINSKIKPGFLRVRINNIDEVIYRAFGDYFYPLDATQEENKQFMARISQNYDSVVSKNNPEWAKLLAEKLQRLGLKKDAKIIDLGAGTGIASEAFAARGYKNLTLFDRSSAMLVIAKKKSNLSKAKFIVADITKLALKEKYDAVISVMLFDDFKPEKKLKETLLVVKNLMKTGSFIAIITDTKENVYPRLFKKIEDGTTKAKLVKITRYYFIGQKS